jgi:hypothetical protein
VNPAAVVLVTTVAFCIGRASTYRALRAKQDELEYQRLRVDDVDAIVDRKDRYRHQAHHWYRRVKELAR